MSTKKLEPLLTLREAAEILGVHPNSLRSWDNAGILVAVRVGARRDRRYQPSDLRKYMLKGRSTK